MVATRIQFLDTKQSESVPLPEPEYTSNVVEERNSDPFADFGEQVSIDDNFLE